VLSTYEITAVADVRSRPYSKYKAEFNRETLSATLKRLGIVYVFLGDMCGARPDDTSCYTDNIVNFELLSKHPSFQKGIERLREGMERFRIALMCAEKDPISCHRMVLVSRRLLEYGDVRVCHILDNGAYEENSQAERRLLRLFGLDVEELPGLGRSHAQRLAEAYARQGARIAYHEQEEREEAVEASHG
jgi:uncharacterized protein (DUF488 family)